jgi:hypothetical protein
VTPSPRVDALAATLFATGVGLRLVMPDGLRPEAEALAYATLFLGGGLLVFQSGLRGRGVFGAAGALLLLCVLAPAFRSWADGARLFFLGLATLLAAYAARALHDGPRANAWRGALAPIVVLLSAYGVAQTLYLRDAAEAFAATIDHPLLATEQGRAFLASRRASAVFLSPNVFGGFLLLCAPTAIVAAARRSRQDGVVVAALSIGAFVAAGSAGATIAAILAAPIALSRVLKSARARRALVVATIFGALGVAALVVAARAHEGPTGKLLTLAERLDYGAAGLRMLGDALPFGFGYGTTAERVGAYYVEGEARSRSLHDWWLEGLVEGGVFFVVVAAALIVGAARAFRRAGETDVATVATDTTSATLAETSPSRSGRAVVFGLAAGVFVAGVVHPFTTFFPPNFEVDPALEALGFAAIVALLAARYAGPPAARGRAESLATLFGVVAFLLHGFVDFDLSIAPAAVALGLLYGRLPRVADAAAPPGASRTSDRLSIAFGLLVALAGPPAVLFVFGR